MNNRQALRAIIRKDIRSVTSSVQLWLPMLIVPLIIGIIVPSALIWAASNMNLHSINNINVILETLNKAMQGGQLPSLAGMTTDNQRIVYYLGLYMFAPLFLIIPVMASSILTANSFAGEKERKTLEGLLFTPMSMETLFTGKVLAALIPSILLSWITFILYGIIANILMYTLFDKLMFPNVNWIILILWVVPTCSLAVILLNVLISAKVRGFQEAYQLGGLVVLPLLGLIAGQATGMLMIGPWMLLGTGAVMLIISCILLRLVTVWNRRQQLAESQI
ncbi:ABC transporter permease subunit [Paenibacillus silvae]|uniref:ABC transporter permease subunit n=1 Tax=Paenibacillus silvae TaxID=1325358 RepID=UPI0020050009|nr:ABC transporter permease subunit [Paenibacillus silvae]MCK6074845.1 ABC transporter permease subunit [Paenibacillus silvae]MCK6147680.1 ABC transporter permease subunit [Paenibacillus silvae]MCK6265978.1 ABC transporter permease subunit [Paenibacillus silvae]